MRDQRKLRSLRGGYSIRNWTLPTKDPDTGKWELHTPLSNYLGPQTRVRWRLANGIPPTTNTDAGAKQHDLMYANIATRMKRGTISRGDAWNQIKSADNALIKTGIRNIKSKNPVEVGHAILATSGIIGKRALQEIGLMDELKFINPESAGDDELEMVGQGKIRKKKKVKVDRLKDLKKRFKKAKI